MWQDEFKIAKKLNLDLIELILDFDLAEENPLFKKSGIKELKTIIKDTGVGVQSICADYFMEAPLHSDNQDIVISSQKAMFRLIDSAKSIGATDIIIPCVDHSSLIDQKSIIRFVKNLKPIIKLLEEYCINLSIESDLKPQDFVDLLSLFQSERITVNYDTGNSASLGYDVEEELSAYGNRISVIHIKDRILGGGPVFFGDGNTDFKKFFKKIRNCNYTGPFIMQLYRDEEGLKIFQKQLSIVSNYIHG